MGETGQFIVRKAGGSDDWEDAMALAWRTFNRYVASDYSLLGVKNFQDFVSDNGLYKMYSIGEYHLWVAEFQGEIIGMISLRAGNHISLLFVDGRYHKMGIGSLLMRELWDYILQSGGNFCTVNASPYGIDFYHKLGFEDTGEQFMNGGMYMTPMRIRL